MHAGCGVRDLLLLYTSDRELANRKDQVTRQLLPVPAVRLLRQLIRFGRSESQLAGWASGNVHWPLRISARGR
jgi:hypothetical protein